MSQSLKQSIRVLPFVLLGSFGCASAPTSASDGTQQAGLTGPAVAGEAPGKSPFGVTAKCDAYATHQSGPYRYSNNQWGSKKAKGKAEQCLLLREVDGHTEVGWTWNWPGFDPSVFAYPEIEFGWKPWSGGKSTDARFPIKVSEVPRVTLHYEVDTVATGSYDLAPEVWLTDSVSAPMAPNPKSITTEIMFWMDYTSGARPAGRVIATPNIGGVEYELWKEDTIGVDANGKGWTLLSFKSPKVVHRGTLAIDAFLEHLVDAKLVNANDYLASIEFGNEVMGGSGTTWVKHFEIEVGD